MDIKKKYIIISGGVKGIGYSIVNKFISEGATVGIFDIDRKGFDELIIKDSENIFFMSCDVTDLKQVESAVDKFFNKFKRIDVLINNAGIIYNDPLVRFEGGKLKT